QPYSLTTPPYRNGTMANPLPNTNAPALVKKIAICVSSSLKLAFAPGTAAIRNGGAILATVVAGSALRGHVRTAHTITPAPRNNQILSDSVMIVTAALAR